MPILAKMRLGAEGVIMLLNVLFTLGVSFIFLALLRGLTAQFIYNKEKWVANWHERQKKAWLLLAVAFVALAMFTVIGGELPPLSTSLFLAVVTLFTARKPIWRAVKWLGRHLFR